jgi:hypothetical protein
VAARISLPSEPKTLTLLPYRQILENQKVALLDELAGLRLYTANAGGRIVDGAETPQLGAVELQNVVVLVAISSTVPLKLTLGWLPSSTLVEVPSSIATMRVVNSCARNNATQKINKIKVKIFFFMMIIYYCLQ